VQAALGLAPSDADVQAVAAALEEALRAQAAQRPAPTPEPGIMVPDVAPEAGPQR
jgi:hypothetical protein